MRKDCRRTGASKHVRAATPPRARLGAPRRRPPYTTSVSPTGAHARTDEGPHAKTSARVHVGSKRVGKSWGKGAFPLCANRAQAPRLGQPPGATAGQVRRQ
jgi:hypothetical protein